MKHIVLAVTVGIAILSGRVALARPQITDDEITTILRHRLDRAKEGIGIVVGLVDENGTRVVGYGKPTKGSLQTVDGDTVFEIGSVTKVFTTILLAESAEHGALSLDDPISKYLPNSVRAPERNGKQITLAHLATHTSSLPNMPRNCFGIKAIIWNVFSCGLCPSADFTGSLFSRYSVDQMFEFLSKYRLKRDIGSAFEYSNYAFGLLGQILELRLGSDYEALVRKHISQPLTMDHTGIQLTAEMQRRLATGHDEGGKPVRNWNMPAFAGSGALRSTTNDLLKFVAANVGLNQTSLLTAMRRTHQQQFQCCEIGLGWVILRQFDEEILVKSGGTGGYAAFIGLDPRKRKGVVVLSNSDNDVSDVGKHLLDEIHYPLDKNPRDRNAIIPGPEKASLKSESFQPRNSVGE